MKTAFISYIFTDDNHTIVMDMLHIPPQYTTRFSAELRMYVKGNDYAEVYEAIKRSKQKLIQREVLYSVKVTYTITEDQQLLPTEWVLYFVGKGGNQILTSGDYTTDV